MQRYFLNHCYLWHGVHPSIHPSNSATSFNKYPSKWSGLFCTNEQTLCGQYDVCTVVITLTLSCSRNLLIFLITCEYRGAFFSQVHTEARSPGSIFYRISIFEKSKPSKGLNKNDTKMFLTICQLCLLTPFL